MNEAEALRRFLAGHEAAAILRRQLRREEGPDPERAAREVVDALQDLMDRGLWPGPRDRVSERQVDEVRRRWALIQHRARAQQG
jgi:hypothetical protein